MAAAVKSSTPQAATSAERPVTREALSASQVPGFAASAGNPVDRLQGSAGNRAVSTLLSHRPAAGAGQPLPRRLRGEMEKRFGEDFSVVRVHFGAPAAKAATGLRAKAYTIDQHIVFADRAYAPETFEGRRLLAHELAHVVQQRRGGIAPELRRGSALEQAADQTARAVTNGFAPVVVGGASAVGVAREGSGDDDEIERALGTWTHLDKETEEEARRKPGPSPKREADKESPHTTNSPPSSNRTDAVLNEETQAKQKAQQDLLNERKRAEDALRDDSRAKRKARQDLLDERKHAAEEARKQNKEPPRIDPKPPPGMKVGEYQDAVRAMTHQGAQDEAARHATVMHGQTAMTPEHMYTTTIGMRGFQAGVSVWELGEQKQEYDRLKKELENYPPAEIRRLEKQNARLQREIAKLDKERRKQGGLATEDKERLDKLKAKYDANKRKIEVPQRVNSLQRSLSISGLRDPDAPHNATGAAAQSKGARAGRGENTYAMIQVIGADGKIVAVGMGQNGGNKHAEQHALDQIEHQIHKMPGGKLPPGSRIEVVGDQEVCTAICRKDLAKFAAAHGVERVDGYTFNAVKPNGKKLSPKATAVQVTTAESGGWSLERRHDPIYTAASGMIGGEELTPGEKHRHAHGKAAAKTGAATATKKPRAKGPESNAGKPAAGKSAQAKPTAAKPAESAEPPAKPATKRKASAKPRKLPAKGKAPSVGGEAMKSARQRRAAPTASVPPAATAGSQKASKRPKQATTRKLDPVPRAAPPRAKGAVKSATAAKPSAPAKKAAQRAAPAKPQAGAPAAKRETKPPAPPPPAPRLPPRTTAKIAGGATASAKAKARAQQSRAPAAARPKPAAKPTAGPAKSSASRAKPAAKPTGKPAPRRSPSPPAMKSNVSTGKDGGTFLAPGSAGATGHFGADATQDHGKGVTTGQSVGFDGSVSVDVTEVPDTDPQEYQVTLKIDLSGQLTLEAGKQSAGGGAHVGASVSASGSLSQIFSTRMSADAARQYRLAAEKGTGGKPKELEIVRLVATHQIDAAKTLLEEIHAQAGSAEAAKNFAKGQVVETAVQGTVGGDVSAGGSLGVKLGVFRTGSVTRRIEERDGKIVVTMTVESGTGTTLGGTFNEGVVGFGASHTGAESRLRGVSFTLDPNSKDFAAQFNSVSSVGSIDALDRMRAAHPELAGATTTGKGKSSEDDVGGSVLGFGGTFSQGGTVNEQEIHDERGTSYHNEATSSVGLKLTAADRAIASSSETDSLVTDVGPDNRATGETRATRHESDIGRSVTALRKSFAKDPVTTVTGVVTGKTKVLQEKQDQSGKALTDDSFTRLSEAAKNGRDWEHLWVAGHGDIMEWRKTRQKILAANGNRELISRALDDFSGGGELTSLTIQKAVGDTGIAFEFPDAIADQKPAYDAFIVGDPIAHAHELAERGQQQAAINELNAANDKLSKLVGAVGAHQAEFQNQAKMTEMLNRVSDRRAQLRGEIRSITRAAAPQAADAAPKPEIGPPTPQQTADAEADKQAQATELAAKQLDLQNTCRLNRTKEIAAFNWIREEMDTWHFDSQSASIEMMNRLNVVRDSWGKWDETIEKLKAVYTDLGQDPAGASALAPDRKQWDAVDALWKKW